MICIFFTDSKPELIKKKKKKKVRFFRNILGTFIFSRTINKDRQNTGVRRRGFCLLSLVDKPPGTCSVV